MSDIFCNKKKELEKETKEIESTIIPQCRKKGEEMENKLSTTIAEFDEMDKKEKRIETYGTKKWTTFLIQ
jgi:hypothetical protein